MLKKAALLTVSVTLIALTSGCGGAGRTPAEVAESYGILNRYGLDKDIAGVIQSGQADYMIAQGHAHVRSRVNGRGKDRVLVTEYLIQGEPYRIEVRRPVDPIKDVREYEVMAGYARQQSDEQELLGLRLDKVASVLKDDSYEAKPVVAYRAWQDLEGKVHPIRVMDGSMPDWQPTDDAMNLTLRTRGDWPIVSAWIRGITTDGRRRDPEYGDHEWAWDGPYSGKPQDSPSGNPATSSAHAVNGQWIIESPGPGVPGQSTEVNGRTHFVNLELYDAIVGS
jgi:hypothetical protein